MVQPVETDLGRRRGNWTSEVVVVDDDVALGRQIVAYLTRTGIRAIHEDNASSAIEAIQLSHPDVVVMDIDMPGMDGLEAAKILADEAPGTRLILMSGYLDQLQRAHSENLGVFAVVDKPLPLHMLARFIQNALGGMPRHQTTGR